MRKPAFLSNERLSRFLVSILLTMGLLLPLMFTFEAESALALAIASATAVTVLCTALGTLRRGRLVLGIVGGCWLRSWSCPIWDSSAGPWRRSRPFPCISTA